jgi:hypothetical protein
MNVTPVAHAIRVLSRGAFLARRAMAPEPRAVPRAPQAGASHAGVATFFTSPSTSNATTHWA